MSAPLPHRTRGYTLVEVVAVMTVLGIVGMVGFQVVLSAMGTYTRAAPALAASYEAHHALQRLVADLRDLAATDTITTFATDSITFDDSAGDTLAYALDGTDLECNGDVLAGGVSAFELSYWQSDGTTATTAADLHLVEVALTAEVAGQSHVLHSAVFPRVLTALPEGSGGSGGGASSGNLIAHWDLDESSGTNAAENIAGNDGTLLQGASFGAGGSPAGGTAVTVDGTNDYVESAHDDAYLLDEGTIQLWFRADDTSGNQGLFSKDSTNYDTGGHVNIGLVGDDVQVRLQSTSTSYTVQASNVVSSSTWHHVAFSFGPAGMRLYVDGVLEDTDAYTGGTGTSSGGAGNHEPIVFGSSCRVSGNLSATPLEQWFDGRIDEVAIYDAQLTDAEVTALYTAGGDL